MQKRIAALGNPPDCCIFTGDVNLLVPEIQGALPKFSRSQGLISFCFVDPFAANIRFDTLRALSNYRFDFLILLMLGLDIRLNFEHYLADESDDRIAALIDDPDWRADYHASQDRDVVRYILRRFNERMVSLGYQPSNLEDSFPVRIPKKDVLIYSLVYYSKHPLGLSFWKATKSGIDRQLWLDF